MRAALARGEEVNQRDAEGNTGLMVAAGRGNEAVVELLLQQPGLDVNHAKEVILWTALHMACRQGYTRIVLMLLAHPSLTCHNAVNSEGCTPLMLAVRMNRVKCVREMMAVEGVDLETRDPWGRGLEEAARCHGGPEAWQVVREGKRRREVQVKKEVWEKREEAKNKLTKENIDNLVDFIEGNDKKMAKKKKNMKKIGKIEKTKGGILNITETSLERKGTRQMSTNIGNGGNNIIEKESVSNKEDVTVDPLEAETIFQCNSDNDFLNRDIENKLQILIDKKKYANDISKSKGKEIADLLLGIDIADNIYSEGIEEIDHIDNQRGRRTLVISHKCWLISWLILAPRPPMHFLHKTFPGTSDKIFHCAKFHSSICLIS